MNLTSGNIIKHKKIGLSMIGRYLDYSGRFHCVSFDGEEWYFHADSNEEQKELEFVAKNMNEYLTSFRKEETW